MVVMSHGDPLSQQPETHGPMENTAQTETHGPKQPQGQKETCMMLILTPISSSWLTHNRYHVGNDKLQVWEGVEIKWAWQITQTPLQQTLHE